MENSINNDNFISSKDSDEIRTINPKNNADKCFQYTITAALNH